MDNSVVRWCCISIGEQKKCEEWALNIKSDPLVCVRAVSMSDCIEKIKVRTLAGQPFSVGRICLWFNMLSLRLAVLLPWYCVPLPRDTVYHFVCVFSFKRDEVDAVSLDASHVYIAGKCGLVPVAAEYYGKSLQQHSVEMRG